MDQTYRQLSMIYIGNCSYKMISAKWGSTVDAPKFSIFRPDNFVNIYWSKNEDRAVTSCFRSKTERELNATRKNNIVPGPGTYDLKLEVNLSTYTLSTDFRLRSNFDNLLKYFFQDENRKTNDDAISKTLFDNVRTSNANATWSTFTWTRLISNCWL